ncbi:hypothetical protein [Bacillus sp. NPDC094106]|uniref:hypothetical protein n=1 Tax=Bacillus sp. NPDC094106 TaxID=3363949 RepID=UPI003828BF60
MIDFKVKLDKDADVSVEAFKNFHTFLADNLFTELPEGTTVDLDCAYTTFSYLQVKYIIRIPSQAVLSIYVLGFKSFNGEERFIHTDFLRGDCAIVNNAINKTLWGVNVFEGEFQDYKAILYNQIIPLCEKYKHQA